MMQLEVARASYRAMVDRLRNDHPDLDDETLADTLEGVSALPDLIATIVRSALTDEALALGLKDRISEMQQRFERLCERAEQRRRVAREIMAAAEITKITAPDMTLSIRLGNPSVEVVDEQLIPQTYWEPRPPRLDRQAILAALKNGIVIDGAALSPPRQVLTVRTK